MEKKPEDESESDKTEKISCNEDSKQSNRVQLSPHSHNVSESAKKMVVVDNTDKRYFNCNIFLFFSAKVSE